LRSGRRKPRRSIKTRTKKIIDSAVLGTKQETPLILRRGASPHALLPARHPLPSLRSAKSAAPLPPCTTSCGNTQAFLGARAPALTISADIRSCCSCSSRRSRASLSSSSSRAPQPPPLASPTPRGDAFTLHTRSGARACSLSTSWEQGVTTRPPPPPEMSLLRKPEGPAPARRSVRGGQGERRSWSAGRFDGARAGARRASRARCSRLRFSSARAHRPSQHLEIPTGCVLLRVLWSVSVRTRGATRICVHSPARIPLSPKTQPLNTPSNRRRGTNDSDECASHRRTPHSRRKHPRRGDGTHELSPRGAHAQHRLHDVRRRYACGMAGAG
jgi:hypothetical protein